MILRCDICHPSFISRGDGWHILRKLKLFIRYHPHATIRNHKQTETFWEEILQNLPNKPYMVGKKRKTAYKVKIFDTRKNCFFRCRLKIPQTQQAIISEHP